MSIVIATPTGQIGSRVTQLLIQAGVRPTLLVRDANKLSAEVRSAADVREGNLSDRDFVLNATQGATTLFWLIPSDYFSNDPVGDIERIGQNAAAAITQNGIEHTVLISSMGAETRGGDFIGGLGNVEDFLAATGKHVVFLRPGYFFSNLFGDLAELKQGILPTTVPLDHKLAWNDPRDIAEVAAVRLLNRDWTGQFVQYVAGPRDLSFREVAQIVSDVTGKPIQPILATDEQTRDALVGAGLSVAAADSFVSMSQRISRGVDSERNYVTSTPTTLEAWVYANLRPALAG